MVLNALASKMVAARMRTALVTIIVFSADQENAQDNHPGYPKKASN
jgi:hypothetical protein